LQPQQVCGISAVLVIKMGQAVSFKVCGGSSDIILGLLLLVALLLL